MGVYLLADLDWWLELGNWGSLIRAALGLGFVIFVHELGHFLVAKACGVKCEKFYVGFDPPFKHLPRALWKKKWGETEYGIGIIPLGGYVKMLGQDDNPANAAREAERIRLSKETNDPDGDTPSETQFKLDPRSYPAKSVPQRMAIISAGVIMNMIFAVIFATIAYKMGVSYIPCHIGRTVPGDPAWQAGLQPGDKIVQLGDEDTIDEHLSFTHDLRFAVASTGTDSELKMKVRHADGTLEALTLKPSSSLKEEIGLPSIGVVAGNTNVVESDQYVSKRVAAILGRKPEESESNSDTLQSGDTIVAIQAGGNRYQIDRDSAYQISGILARHRSDAITFDVQRNSEPNSSEPTQELLSITIPPRPMRGLGISMQPGPIGAMRMDSPAEKAGLKPGDIITTVAGRPVSEPLLIDQYLIDQLGKPTELTVKRDGSEISLTVTPEPPKGPGGSAYNGGPISAETIGAAICITDVVGLADEDLGIQPGDTVEKAVFLAKEASEITNAQRLSLGLYKPLTFGAEGKHNWADLIDRVQILPDDMEVHLTVSRGKKQEIIELVPSETEGWFNANRDIAFQQLSEIRTANGIGEAFRLGIGETRNGVAQVIYTLKNIGKHFKQLGGPGTIAVVATSEASQGWPRLLIFLTLLSTNLAVINFLPIPVLDGGHMMFLLAEGIRGKPVNERWAFYLTMIGFSFILALMVFVIGLDLNRFVGMPG